MSELEKERETIEEEKAQVDKYKKLLVKQRDIMVMLTQRLNERDEQIVALQDELDAYGLAVWAAPPGYVLGCLTCVRLPGFHVLRCQL